MQTLKARVVSVLKLQPYRTGKASDDQNKDTISLWHMQVSYFGPNTIHEVELREPLKSLASKQIAVGLNGSAEFDLFSEPHVAAGDSIEIDAYEFGEKILQPASPANLQGFAGDAG
jgi:hypothetical protein